MFLHDKFLDFMNLRRRVSILCLYVANETFCQLINSQCDQFVTNSEKFKRLRIKLDIQYYMYLQQVAENLKTNH